MQLASLERGERVEEEPSTTGRPFEGSDNPSTISEEWAEERLGLMAHLDSSALLWASLTESQEALLTLCGHVVSFVTDDDCESLQKHSTRFALERFLKSFAISRHQNFM